MRIGKRPWQTQPLCTENDKSTPFHEVFNIAYGHNTTLLQLFEALRDNLAKYDNKIINIKPAFRNYRVGDIPHSLASIEKAKTMLNYMPEFDANKGFENACSWYYKNL